MSSASQYSACASLGLASSSCFAPRASASAAAVGRPACAKFAPACRANAAAWPQSPRSRLIWPATSRCFAACQLLPILSWLIAARSYAARLFSSSPACRNARAAFSKSGAAASQSGLSRRSSSEGCHSLLAFFSIFSASSSLPAMLPRGAAPRVRRVAARGARHAAPVAIGARPGLTEGS
ncbi:MAG: hypothetical protein J3K34DRAFT_415831, partial [Monoraphidium minutum]